MIPKKLRAAAMAFLMGTAAMAMVGVFTATPAEAAVRPAVGNPLNDAKAAMSAGNCNAAMASVRKAEGVGGLTADEKSAIDGYKKYIASASKGACGVDSAIGAQAKFAADNRAGRYRDVINDADILRKYGAMTAGNQVVIAQAYYLLREYDSCARYARNNPAGPDMLDLLVRCAYEAHDDTTYRAALEQLVASTNKPEHWQRLLKSSESAKALSDHQTLDIYRIRFKTGSMKGPDDYYVLAQFALQYGYAAEAQSVVDAGVKAGVLKDARAQRLLKLTQDTQAGNLRNLPRTIADANKAKGGDALVRLGEDYTGSGRFKEALDAIQAGIAKGTTDPDNSQIRLGQAYAGLGQKAPALAAFAKVKSGGNTEMTAQLWSLYVKTH